MKIETKTSRDSITLLRADESFIALLRKSNKNEGQKINDRKSAIEFLEGYEYVYLVYQEKRSKYLWEIKYDSPKQVKQRNRAVGSRIIKQLGKIVGVIIKEVIIKLLIEIILSLLRENSTITTSKHCEVKSQLLSQYAFAI